MKLIVSISRNYFFTSTVAHSQKYATGKCNVVKNKILLSRYSTNLEKCEILGQTFCENHSCSANIGDVTPENLVKETIRTFNANF